MGVKVARLEKGKYAFTADAVDLKYLNSQEYNTDAKQLRGSVMLVGPMLTKIQQGINSSPRRDKIEEEGILISMVLSYWAQILTIAKKITFIR